MGVLVKGKVEALVWTGTTPTEAVPTDRRTLIPWRRAGVVSGSCSCNSTGARLRAAGGGKAQAGNHVVVSLDFGPTLTGFPLSDWAPCPSVIQNGGEGRGCGPIRAAIGEV